MNDTSELVSTRDRPGTFDGLESAKPGEPVFTLQGGDPFAAATVLFWVSQARAAGLASENESEATRLLTRASTAEVVAWAMKSYLRNHSEEVEGRHASYTDHDVASVDRNSILARGCDRLHNAVAEITVFAEKLAELREFPLVEAALREAAESIKQQAFAVEPRRQLRRA